MFAHRAQKPFESKKVETKKKRKSTHDKILECCAYFSAHDGSVGGVGGTGEDETYDVTLVTYHNDDDHQDLMVGSDVEVSAKNLSKSSFTFGACQETFVCGSFLGLVVSLFSFGFFILSFFKSLKAEFFGLLKKA